VRGGLTRPPALAAQVDVELRWRHKRKPVPALAEVGHAPIDEIDHDVTGWPQWAWSGLLFQALTAPSALVDAVHDGVRGGKVWGVQLCGELPGDDGRLAERIDDPVDLIAKVCTDRHDEPISGSADC
jgi:hypothetical protein